MKTFNYCCICFLLSAFSVSSQDYPLSVGPAPYALNKAPQSGLFDSQIGTRAFTQISSSPTFQFGKSFLESCAITNIGTAFTITFPGGLVYRNGTVYTWNQSSPFQLWSIDTVTGVHTLVFNMTGPPQVNFTGMTWDGTTMYGVSTNLSVSQIFTINMTTGVCIPIGAASPTCAGAIFVAGRLSAGSGLFSVDIVNDNLYRWNKTTGAATLVGPLGVNANFGQDGQFDNNDGRLYWMAYTTGPELRRLDTAGGSVLLCTYLAQATGIAPIVVVFGSPCLGQHAHCRTGLNIPLLDHQTAKDSVLVLCPPQCLVRDVNVRIDTVTHTWDADLRFYLQRLGTGVRIINQVGGSGDNFIGTILNDSATIPIASGTAPFTGSYIPSAPLTPFNSLATNGYWTLVITDTAGGDSGFLRQWCVVITSDCFVGGIQTLEIPNYYSLSQNYPNPFNPSTKIKFTMPRNENVKLVVYDMLGKAVTTLVNEYRTTGVYEVDFDASNYASGVYFYTIETPNFTQTRKMLLVK